MGYFSDYYLEEFTEDLVKRFLILLNVEKIHGSQKYLLIVVQDLVTDKIVKLVDTHGMKYDLCKHSDDWAKLNKGDIISLKCCFHKSEHCANVLRIKSNYTLENSFDYIKELHIACDSIIHGNQNREHLINILETDLEYLGKKLSGKYGFILFYLENSELLEYQKSDFKKKYQFRIELESKYCYADIMPFISISQKWVGRAYSGFVLLRFAYKNDRLRVKVYDFFNKDNSFAESLPF